MRVILHPEAEAEILGAQRYYSDVRAAFGRRFYDDLSNLLLRVAERPLAFRQFAHLHTGPLPSTFPTLSYTCPEPKVSGSLQ